MGITTAVAGLDSRYKTSTASAYDLPGVTKPTNTPAFVTPSQGGYGKISSTRPQGPTRSGGGSRSGTAYDLPGVTKPTNTPAFVDTTPRTSSSSTATPVPGDLTKAGGTVTTSGPSSTPGQSSTSNTAQQPLTSAYIKQLGGVVTSTGQYYPTTNERYVPQGYQNTNSYYVKRDNEGSVSITFTEKPYSSYDQEQPVSLPMAGSRESASATTAYYQELSDTGQLTGPVLQRDIPIPQAATPRPTFQYDTVDTPKSVTMFNRGTSNANPQKTILPTTYKDKSTAGDTVSVLGKTVVLGTANLVSASAKGYGRIARENLGLGNVKIAGYNVNIPSGIEAVASVGIGTASWFTPARFALAGATISQAAPMVTAKGLPTSTRLLAGATILGSLLAAKPTGLRVLPESKLVVTRQSITRGGSKAIVEYKSTVGQVLGRAPKLLYEGKPFTAEARGATTVKGLGTEFKGPNTGTYTKTLNLLQKSGMSEKQARQLIRYVKPSPSVTISTSVTGASAKQKGFNVVGDRIFTAEAEAQAIIRNAKTGKPINTITSRGEFESTIRQEGEATSVSQRGVTLSSSIPRKSTAGGFKLEVAKAEKTLVRGKGTFIRKEDIIEGTQSTKFVDAGSIRGATLKDSGKQIIYGDKTNRLKTSSSSLSNIKVREIGSIQVPGGEAKISAAKSVTDITPETIKIAGYTKPSGAKVSTYLRRPGTMKVNQREFNIGITSEFKPKPMEDAFSVMNPGTGPKTSLASTFGPEQAAKLSAEQAALEVVTIKAEKSLVPKPYKSVTPTVRDEVSLKTIPRIVGGLGTRSSYTAQGMYERTEASGSSFLVMPSSNSKSRETTSNVFATKSISGLSSAIKSSTISIEIPKLATPQASRSASGLMPRMNEKQIVSPKVTQELKQVQRQIPVQVVVPRITTTTRPPQNPTITRTNIPFRPVTIKIPKAQTVFPKVTKVTPKTDIKVIPEIRRRGKFFAVSGAVSPQEGVRIGIGSVRSGLARTFRLQPVGGVSASQIKIEAPRQDIFRLPKGKSAGPLTFVERSPYALRGSPGAVREIIAARRGR